MISLISFIYNKNDNYIYIEPFDDSLSINCPCPRPKKVKKYYNSSSIEKYKEEKKNPKKCKSKNYNKIYIKAEDIYSESTLKPIGKIDCPLKNSSCTIKNFFPMCQSDNIGYLTS